MAQFSSPDPRELPHDGWSEYLDAVSKELLDAPVSIQISAATGPRVIDADRLVLQSVRYDYRADLFEVAATHDDRPVPSVTRHAINHPTRIQVDSHTLLAPMTIAVDGPHDERTLIRIDRDNEPVG